MLEGFDETAFCILDTSDEGDISTSLLYSFSTFLLSNFHIDEDIGLLLRDIIEMNKDTTACYLVAFDGIGDGDGRLADKPHITIHTTVIGKVELVLLFAWGVVNVVAIISLYGNKTLVASFYALFREIDGDRQIAAKMLFDELAVDIDPLLAHDGFEMNEYLFASHIRRHNKVLAIPADTLIVAATAGFRGLQTVDMRSTDHLPLRVVESCGLGSLSITKPEAPAFVEVIHNTSAAL